MAEKRFAGNIERLRAPERVERLEVERAVELSLEGDEISSVLDVGTGTGLFAEAFAKRGLAVTGMDINPEMIAAASGFVPGGEFQEGTAEALPFPDSSFELVFLGVVLHESEEPLEALKECKRVSRARVAILEWPYEIQPFGPPMEHRLNPEDMVLLFQKAGFRKWKMVDLTNTILYLLEV
jgi:ubiquinone/menaquinone biosynthesis C-methylase UbiE